MTTQPTIDALHAVTRKVHDDLLAAARRTLPERLATPRAQIGYLLQRLGHSTRRTAELLGVHPETVRRYLKGLRKNPPAAFAARLETEVRSRYRPRVPATKVDAAMVARGLRVNLTAAFGFKDINGTSDDPRERQLHADLTPYDTRALLTARDAADEKTAQEIVARGVADDYFQFRGTGLDVAIQDLLFIKFEY